MLHWWCSDRKPSQDLLDLDIFSTGNCLSTDTTHATSCAKYPSPVSGCHLYCRFIVTKNPKVIWMPHHHPSQQRMDSPTVCDAHFRRVQSLSHCMLHPHHSTTLMHAISCNYATKSPLFQQDASHFPPDLPFPLQRSPPPLIHPSLDRSNSPPQMTSRSKQPFSILQPLDRPTDRHINRRTDGWARWHVCSNTHLRSFNYIATRLSDKKACSWPAR